MDTTVLPGPAPPVKAGRDVLEAGAYLSLVTRKSGFISKLR